MSGFVVDMFLTGLFIFLVVYLFSGKNDKGDNNGASV